jgi:hypothetical protein
VTAGPELGPGSERTRTRKRPCEGTNLFVCPRKTMSNKEYSPRGFNVAWHHKKKARKCGTSAAVLTLVFRTQDRIHILTNNEKNQQW